MSNSQLLNNAANGTSGSGGGILNNNGVLTVESSSIRGNSASRAGGGIEVNVGTTATNPVTASINLTTLRGNSTGANTGNGGGLHLTGAGQVTGQRQLGRRQHGGGRGWRPVELRDRHDGGV